MERYKYCGTGQMLKQWPVYGEKCDECKKRTTPKDQDPIPKNSGDIYRYKCGRVECDEEYIGESSRTFEELFREHLKVPSQIHDHYNITGHNVTIENFSIVGREDQNLIRTIQEALYI